MLDSVGVQNEPSQDVSLWYTDCFEVKTALAKGSGETSAHAELPSRTWIRGLAHHKRLPEITSFDLFMRQGVHGVCVWGGVSDSLMYAGFHTYVCNYICLFSLANLFYIYVIIRSAMRTVRIEKSVFLPCNSFTPWDGAFVHARSWGWTDKVGSLPHRHIQHQRCYKGQGHGRDVHWFFG